MVDVRKFITQNSNGLYCASYFTDDGTYHKLITDDYDMAIDFLIPLLERDGLL
jgi:hypothetical protein